MNASRRLHKRRTCFRSAPPRPYFIVTIGKAFDGFVNSLMGADVELGMFFHPNRSLQRRADRSVGELRKWRKRGELSQPRRQYRRSSAWLLRQSIKRMGIVPYTRVIKAYIDGKEIEGIKSIKLERGPSHDSAYLDDPVLLKGGVVTAGSISIVGEAGPELQALVTGHPVEPNTDD